jgi:FkbM family methyltransferase
LDVGAHLGETSFTKAEANPDLQVIAFEPNISLANQTFQRLPNFQVLPIAIGEQTGLATFHLNAFAAASSMLPMDESARKEWIGGEVLAQDSQITVPVMRLDAVMNGLGIKKVDFLKIDAQGGDFAVVKSLGERLRDVRKIKLEVTTKPQQLYVGAATKSEIVAFLREHGFALVSEQSQTHGQEENLVFFQLGPWLQDEESHSPIASYPSETELKQTLLQLPPERLVQFAQSCPAKSVMRRVPNWTFGSFAADTSMASRFRRLLCDVFQERKLTEPIVFHWYDRLKLELHLGNDISLPTFVSGVIDPNEFCFLDAFLKKEMTIVDIGANEGFYTVFVADRVGSQGRVIAFEPSQREVKRLNRNLALNAVANTTVETLGVADSDGHAELKLCEYGHEGQNTLGDFAHRVKQDGTQRVSLVQLDSYFAAHPVTRIDLIKIDVEGAEERVLRGGIQILEQFRPVLLMEMNDQSLRLQGSSCQRIASLLDSMGYCLYCFDRATGKLAAVGQDGYSENIVAAPREKSQQIDQFSSA